MGGYSKFALTIAVGAVCTLAAAQAHAGVLFTTSSDFTGWSPSGSNTNTVAPSTAVDLDGATINGAGNDPGNSGGTLFAGQTSTGGSLQMTWNAGVGSFGTLAFASGEAFNPGFMSAIDPGSVAAFQPPNFTSGSTAAFSGTLQMIYSIPDDNAASGGFFELGVNLAYPADGFFQTFFPTTTTPLSSIGGLTLVQATIPYTITATAGSPDLSGFGFGIEFNSNFAPTQPFFVDSISVLSTPEPASLTLLAGAITLLPLRRRRHA